MQIVGSSEESFIILKLPNGWKSLQIYLIKVILYLEITNNIMQEVISLTEVECLGFRIFWLVVLVSCNSSFANLGLHVVPSSQLALRYLPVNRCGCRLLSYRFDS